MSIHRSVKKFGLMSSICNYITIFMFKTSSSCFETKRFVHDIGSYLGKTKLSLVYNTFIHEYGSYHFFHRST